MDDNNIPSPGFIEEYIPNKFRRRVSPNGGGGFTLDISHNLSDIGTIWSAWSLWTVGDTVDEVIYRHNMVIRQSVPFPKENS